MFQVVDESFPLTHMYLGVSEAGTDSLRGQRTAEEEGRGLDNNDGHSPSPLSPSHWSVARRVSSWARHRVPSESS